MKASFKILLVEDMESFRGAVVQLLDVYNDVDEAGDLATARSLLEKNIYDVVVLDKGLPDGDGIELIQEIKNLNPITVVIVLTSDSDFGSIKHCIARGADDYVIKSSNIVPDLLVRIPVTVSKAAANRRLESLEQQVKEAFRYEIVGKSLPTVELRETILSLKGTGAHVLIGGESGTGKELIARRLNAIEGDGKRPFVAINCGAIPENLIESELFGHKKGAFTGAVADHAGRFELAHNGDLFLDEIGEMPLAAQVRLLRVIQEGELIRVGDSRVIPVKCRVIAATNRNLEQMIREGKFREDLYHRLSVVWIETTPLRNRMSDVPDLARLFTVQVGGGNFKISEQAERCLQEYEWPGNIRELRNTIERAVISAKRRKSQEIKFDDICYRAPKEDAIHRLRRLGAGLPSELNDLSPKKYKDFVDAIEREYFQTALEIAEGSALEIANRIGLARSTVFLKLKNLGISFRQADKKKLSSTVRDSRPRNENGVRGIL